MRLLVLLVLICTQSHGFDPFKLKYIKEGLDNPKQVYKERFKGLLAPRDGTWSKGERIHNGVLNEDFTYQSHHKLYTHEGHTDPSQYYKPYAAAKEYTPPVNPPHIIQYEGTPRSPTYGYPNLRKTDMTGSAFFAGRDGRGPYGGKMTRQQFKAYVKQRSDIFYAPVMVAPQRRYRRRR